MQLQFNSESNNQDLVSDITSALGVGTDQYSLNDRTRDMNIQMSEVWTWIFSAYGGMQFMDDNVSTTAGTTTSGSNTGPYVDIDVTSGISLYGLPTGALTVMGIAIKTSSTSTPNTVSCITHEQFLERGGDGAFPSTVTGTPYLALVFGDIIRFLPTPNFTVSGGARIYFDQEMAAFVPTDTTKKPGFASPYHAVISRGAALRWARLHMPDKVPGLQIEVSNFEKSIKSFYAKRYAARRASKINTGEDLAIEFS